ncbi:MFS transporter [Candidatus Francisella endociliophora]|uniref:Lysosomal dipeptide transporter MFSD1 n=1 Tax=Candidatus Francisella endociliophora TaxID=653937 RepID=A0A097EPE8_9GAMM|nr:MFS transporter [Francisella sp. FSC1006]AIT09443.1 MFS transporter [Francisella sp. FSC1006]
MPNESFYLPAKKSMIFMAWVICLVVTLDYSYDFFIRAAPGVMAQSLSEAFKIDSTQIGWLSSAYFISYTIMQLPAGIILDKYNRKLVIGGATLLCVLGNYLFSATNSYEIAFIGRIFMGIGSAFGFIGAAKMAAMWLPRRFFSAFISFATMIGILGGLVTDTFLSTLVRDLGWRQGNEVFTYIGVAILLLVFILVKDNKKFVEQHSHINNASLLENIQMVARIFTNYKFWAAALIGAALFIPINVLGSLWGVGFIQAKYQLSEAYASYINSILFLGTAIGFGLAALISIFTTRFRLMLTISLFSLVVISAILLYMDISLKTFIVLYFFLGLMSGSEALTFAIGRFISPKGTAGSATAGINLINNMIPVILLPAIGHILVKYGSFIKGSSSIYTISSYHHALAVIIVLLIICLPITMLLPRNTEI